MRIRVGLAIAGVWLGLCVPAWAQFKQGEVSGAKIGKSETSRWRYGMVIRASGGSCRGLTGYIPIPTDWPEQQVSIVTEEIAPEARVHYELVDGGVKVMNVRIGQVNGGEEAKILVTVEISRNVIIPPEKTDVYEMPDVKKLSRQMRAYLLPSPKIECRDPKIKELAKKIGVDKKHAWDHVEAIYDWVRGKVKYKTGPLKGALAALRDGTGDCEEITSLFIAICRAAEIPARSVWVPGHCYPEFYLEDDKGKGHWFPCQSAGSREFGGITELRPILQKGDNFRPPKNSHERQRYMSEHIEGSRNSGNGEPQVRFIREAVAK